MCLVSIIVPVYNIENYLEKCLESLVTQTLEEIEIILVNDGSTDGSESICKRYVAKDTRVHLINQANAGVSAARNTGLACAKGQYILFIDGDDYVSEHMIEELYQACKRGGAPMSMCEYFEVHGKQVVVQPLHIEKEVLEQEEIISEILAPMIGSESIGRQGEIFRGYVWRILYNRSFIERHQLRFESEREILFEDIWFNIKAYYFAEKVALVKKPLYYYVYRAGSLTKGYRKHYFEAAMVLNQRMMTFARENELDQVLSSALTTRQEIFLWESIYIATHPMNPSNFHQKLAEIHKICGHDVMRQIIQNLPRDEVEKSYKLKCYLIQKGQFWLLCYLMTVWHWLKQVKGKVRAYYEG